MAAIDLSSTTSERASLEIDGTTYEVVALDGREAVSRLFAFRITCEATVSDPPPRALIGGAATITLRSGAGFERRIHGLVARAGSEVFDEGHVELTVEVRPAIYPLTLGRDSRVFQDSTVVDIVKKVLTRTTAPTRWEVGPHAPHVYCAQYREDDWTFCARMLEEEGIYYWFDHGDDESTLVFGDRSTGAADIPGGAYLAFSQESGLRKTIESIEELGAVVQAVPGKFTVGSFNPERPLFKVEASTGKGPFEVYEAPGGGPESPAVCGARAQLMSEAAAAAGTQVYGVSSSVRLVPGMAVEIDGHPLARLDGRYFVTEVGYELRQRSGRTGGGHRPYVCRFRAIPLEAPFRAPMETPLAEQAGLQSGVVVGGAGEEIMPDDKGRVRVQLHWDREGGRDAAAGKWMRVAQRSTASSMLLPRVGWNVMTLNDEGTVDAPHVLSRVHDAEHPPSYPLPANKTRYVVKTATSPGGGSFNEIRYEDLKGSEEMFLNASRDMSVLIQNLKNEEVGRDAARTVGVNHDLTVGIDRGERVANDQTVAVAVNEKLDVSGDRDGTVKGNETISIGGKRSLHTGDFHKNNVTLTRELKVGAALIDVTLGPVVANAAFAHILVGGAMIKVSAQSITEVVSKLSVQTVGGIKMEMATKKRPLSVSKRLLETVGGAMVLKTDKGFTDTARTTSSYTVGGALTAKAPDILIEATEKIEIKCGGSTITVLPDSVELSATMIDLSGAPSFDADAGMIKHN
jgi:type VI secretion system secreted protein VgrG